MYHINTLFQKNLRVDSLFRTMPTFFPFFLKYMSLPEYFSSPAQKLEVTLKKPIIERVGSFLWGALKIIFVLVVIGFILQGQKLSKDISLEPFQSSPINAYFQNEPYNDLASHIGMMTLSGEISDFSSGSFSSSNSIISSDETIAILERMAKEEDLEAILLRIDSPGGEVLAARKIADMIRDIDANQKPVYVLMENIAASGGYYISVSARKIYAYPETLLGNIGVRIDIPNIEELLKKIGVEMQSVTSGEFKDMGTPYREMTDGEKEIFTALIEESYNQFVSTVAQGRKMSVEEVTALADGRIYSGVQAKKNGLIDEIVLSLSDVTSLLQKELGETKEIQFIEYRKTITPWEEILMSVSSWGKSLEVSHFLTPRFLAE